jgi:CubicO group peptidase (beta-lactamase class C family)
MKKAYLILSIFLLAFYSCKNSQKEENPSLNNEFTTQIDSLFNKWNNKKSAGASIAIWKDNNIYTINYGMSDIENQKPVSDTTKFDIASMSKQFTNMSILLLEEEGLLSIDDDIRKYLPELPDYKTKVTIENLMAHTSGVRDHFLLMQLTNDCGTDTTISNQDLLRLISRQETLSFEPGSQQIYCNSGYVLLAIIVERVSKMSFSEYTKRNIFDPLEMNHSYFIDSENYLEKHCAKGYLFDNTDSTYKYIPNYSTATGGTGMTSTATDLIKWYLNFKNNMLGKKDQNLIKKLTSIPQIKNYIPFKRGYGMYVDNYNNTFNYWMSGSEIGYSSIMTYFPQQDFIAIVLSNTSRGIDFNNRYDIAKLFFEFNKSEAQDSISDDELRLKNHSLHTQEELKNLEGIYFDFKELDMEYLQYKDSALYTFLGSELIPTGKYKFKLEGKKTDFSFDVSESSPINFQTNYYSYGDQYEYNYPLRECNLTKQLDPEITPENIIDITGQYLCAGTHKVVNINYDDNGLFVQWEGDDKFYVQPIFSNYLLSFERYAFFEVVFNENKDVIGINISYDRLRNLFFEK